MQEMERQLRINLAAAYRLVALYGWDDLIFTHLSARIPGPEHHFLINPSGMTFDEISASSLVKVGLDGEPIEATEYGAGVEILDAQGMELNSSRAQLGANWLWTTESEFQYCPNVLGIRIVAFTSYRDHPVIPAR